MDMFCIHSRTDATAIKSTGDLIAYDILGKGLIKIFNVITCVQEDIYTDTNRDDKWKKAFVSWRKDDLYFATSTTQDEYERGRGTSRYWKYNSIDLSTEFIDYSSHYPIYPPQNQFILLDNYYIYDFSKNKYIARINELKKYETYSIVAQNDNCYVYAMSKEKFICLSITDGIKYVMNMEDENWSFDPYNDNLIT